VFTSDIIANILHAIYEILEVYASIFNQSAIILDGNEKVYEIYAIKIDYG